MGAVNGKHLCLQDISSQHFGPLAFLSKAQMHEREREFKCELKAGLWRMAMGQVILPPFRGGCTWYPGWEKTRTGPTRHSCNEHRNSSPRRNTRWKLKSFCHQPTNWSVPSWENNSLTLYYETKVSATIFAARFAFIQENLVVSIRPASIFKSTLWSIDSFIRSTDCNEYGCSSPRTNMNWKLKNACMSSQTDPCAHVIGLWTSFGAKV